MSVPERQIKEIRKAVTLQLEQEVANRKRQLTKKLNWKKSSRD
jgi:hypothetical protein